MNLDRKKVMESRRYCSFISETKPEFRVFGLVWFFRTAVVVLELTVENRLASDSEIWHFPVTS